MTHTHLAQPLTRDAFAALGVGSTAYVRPAMIQGHAAYTIHTVDGAQIGQAPTRALAFAAIIQHELEPVDAN